MFCDQAEDALVLLQDNPEQFRQGRTEEERVVHRGGPETLATPTIRRPNLENQVEPLEPIRLRSFV